MIAIPQFFFLFTLAFGVMLLATFIMGQQGKHFYTMDVVERKFSMLDLEFAPTPQELATIINGIYELHEGDDEGVWLDRSHKVIRALKGQLLVDTFLFMPATYGGIFLLCMKVATKMGDLGQRIFIVLAWLQAIAFVLDLIENIYLYQKIKHNTKPSSKAVHNAYQLLEAVKWGGALTASVFAIAASLCFWVTGSFQRSSLVYLIIIAAEILLFLIAGWLVKKADKERRTALMVTENTEITTVQSN